MDQKTIQSPNKGILASRYFSNHGVFMIDENRMQRAISLLNSAELCIEANNKEVLAGVGTISRPETDDEFWGGYIGELFRPYAVRNSIAYIGVKGILLNDFPFQVGSYATGYEYIDRAISRAMKDEKVEGIALLFDSPGGMVSGCFELALKIQSLRSEKRIEAFANEACSAAYALASSTSKVTMSNDGIVGSVGVITTYVDMSKFYESMGIKFNDISAPQGGYKGEGSSSKPMSEHARKRIQTHVDHLYDVFLSVVSSGRNISENDVRETKALWFSSTEAIANNFADQVSPMETALENFELSVNDKGKSEMTDTKKPVKTAEEDTPVAILGKPEVLKLAKEHGITEAHYNQGYTEGAAAERSRIHAIMNSPEGKERPKAALATAFKTSMSSEEAAEYLQELPVETVAVASEPKTDANANGQNFDKAMRDTSPNVGGGEDGVKAEDASDNDVKLARDYGIAGY